MASAMSGMVLATLAAGQVPKKYKSHFILTIYSKYFQSPLIGDFVPELSESGEIKSQRESLIRQVVTPEYLDYLGTKFGAYSSVTPESPVERLQARFRTWTDKVGVTQPVNRDSRLSSEREALRSRIEIYPLNSTTFEVGFIYSDPAATYAVTRDIYTEVIQSLLGIRVHTLANIRDAVQRQLKSMPVPAAASLVSAPPEPVNGAEAVEDDLASVRGQLRALSGQYTGEHPLVIQLRDRERILVGRLASQRASGYRTRGERGMGPTGSPEGNRDIYGDLAKKLNYLNIAIDSDREHQGDYFATLETPLYPSAPLWPKKSLFALWGLALGLFGSLFIAAIKENFDRSALHADALGRMLGLPVLGELPTLPVKAPANSSPASSAPPGHAVSVR